MSFKGKISIKCNFYLFIFLESLGPLTLTLELGREVEAGGALIGSSSESGGVVGPVSRRWGTTLYW